MSLSLNVYFCIGRCFYRQICWGLIASRFWYEFGTIGNIQTKDGLFNRTFTLCIHTNQHVAFVCGILISKVKIGSRCSRGLVWGAPSNTIWKEYGAKPTQYKMDTCLGESNGLLVSLVSGLISCKLGLKFAGCTPKRLLRRSKCFWKGPVLYRRIKV